jgi:hypothetical protein
MVLLILFVLIKLQSNTKIDYVYLIKFKIQNSY